MIKKYTDSSPPVVDAAIPVGWSWVRERLDEKASKETMMAIFEGVKTEISDVKSVALAAVEKAEKPHVCRQEVIIKRMGDDQQELRNMLKVRSYINIGTIVAIVTALVAAIAFFIRLESSVETMNGTVTDLKNSKPAEIQKDVAKYIFTEMDKRGTR